MTTTAPAFARSGEPMPFTTKARSDARIQDSFLTITYRKQTRTVRIPVAERESAIAELAPEGSGAAVTATIEWTQNRGEFKGCEGREIHSIPVIPADGRAGDPDVPRAEGLFEIRYRPLPTKNQVGSPLGPGTTKWRIRPRCAYFGCASFVRSSAGLKALLRPDKSDGYVLRKRDYGVGDCNVLRPGKGKQPDKVVTIRDAFIFTRDARFDPDKARDGVLLEFSGRLVDTLAPTKRAQRQGCTKTFYDRERVTGTRISATERGFDPAPVDVRAG